MKRLVKLSDKKVKGLEHVKAGQRSLTSGPINPGTSVMATYNTDNLLFPDNDSGIVFATDSCTNP